MSMSTCRRSHQKQKGVVSWMVLQLVVETTMVQMIAVWRLQKADLTWRNHRLPRPIRINSSFYQSISLYMPTD